MHIAAELIRKLGIRPYSSIAAINAASDTLTGIQEGLPEGAMLLTGLPNGKPVNIVLAWFAAVDNPTRLFQKLRQAITTDGAIWAVIPKKTASTGKAGSITFDQVQAAALETDLVDNKVVSFPADEYGIRFVIRREKRAN